MGIVWIGLAGFFALQTYHISWKLSKANKQVNEIIILVSESNTRINKMRQELRWPEIICVTNRQWKVTEGDFNVLIDKLQSRGFSNTVISMEKNGHLFDVDVPNRTNATIRYIGKKL